MAGISYKRVKKPIFKSYTRHSKVDGEEQKNGL